MSRVQSIAPILPVADVAAALEHYRALGFEADAHEGVEEYGFVRRDGVELQLSHMPHADR